MTVITDFYKRKFLNIEVSELVADPLIIESELDDSGVYKSLMYSVGFISGAYVYCYITNDIDDLLSIDITKCIKLGGVTSTVDIGRGKYLAVFVGADSAEINIVGHYGHE